MDAFIPCEYSEKHLYRDAHQRSGIEMFYVSSVFIAGCKMKNYHQL